jgi:hypothetical protein
MDVKIIINKRNLKMQRIMELLIKKKFYINIFNYNIFSSFIFSLKIFK